MSSEAETALDSNLVGLHLPRTATAERKARDTMRVLGPWPQFDTRPHDRRAWISQSYSPKSHERRTLDEVLDEGATSPLPTSYWFVGTLYKLPQRGLGRSTAARRFSCILEAPDGRSWNSLGVMAPLPPPNPPLRVVHRQANLGSTSN